ncbi:MAG: hypothetical protein KF832_08375 [Caldilineaceae bacterium]|nr:hypothetical protein [Caldilineaceae bacterium]
MMKQKFSYLLLALVLLLVLVLPASAQMGIGTNTPDPSAAVDIVSTTQGALLPRLTTAQRDAIASPAEGLTIYNTTDKCIQVWDGSAWDCAVGGSSTVVDPVEIDATTTQVFAVDNAMYFGSLTATPYHSQSAWIDNNTFAVLSIVSCTVALCGTTDKTLYIVEIFDVNFGFVRSFEVTEFRGYATDPQLTALPNGNLVLSAQGWNETNSAWSLGVLCPISSTQSCIGYTVVDPQGAVVVPRTLRVPVAGQGNGDVRVAGLDNGNFLITRNYWASGSGSYNLTIEVFAPDGTSVRTLSVPGSAAGGYTAAPSTFGFIVVMPPPSSGSSALTYRAYDFDGNLLGSLSQIADSPTSNFYANVSNYAGLHPSLVRGQGDTFFLIRGDSAEPPITGDPCGGGALTCPPAILTFVAGTTTITPTIETAIGTVQQPWFNHKAESVGGVIDGKLLYIGDTPGSITRFMPVGVFTDGSPFFAQETDALLTTYNPAGGQFTTIQSLVVPPGMRLDASYLSFHNAPTGGSWTFGTDEDSMLLSPDRQKALIEWHVDGTIYSVLDVSDLANIKRYPFSALKNNQPQYLGKYFIISSPFTSLQQVQVSITGGLQSGDSFTCACSPTTVGSVNIPGGIILNAASPAPVADFITSLNEVRFKTTGGAGERTISVQATDSAGVLGEIATFTLNVH